MSKQVKGMVLSSQAQTTHRLSCCSTLQANKQKSISCTANCCAVIWLYCQNPNAHTVLCGFQQHYHSQQIPYNPSSSCWTIPKSRSIHFCLIEPLILDAEVVGRACRKGTPSAPALGKTAFGYHGNTSSCSSAVSSHQDEFTPAPRSNSGFEHFTLSSNECTHRCASTHTHTDWEHLTSASAHARQAAFFYFSFSSGSPSQGPGELAQVPWGYQKDLLFPVWQCFCCLLPLFSGSALHLTPASLSFVSRICLCRVKCCLLIPFNLPATDGSCQSPSSVTEITAAFGVCGLWGGCLLACFGTTDIHQPSDLSPWPSPRSRNNTSTDMTRLPKGTMENAALWTAQLLCCWLERRKYNRSKAEHNMKESLLENGLYFNHLILA